MAGGIALSGNDTVNINGHIFNNLADGDCVVLTFPNEIAKIKIGKNGNAIYGLDTTGQMAEVKIRVLRGSQDDQFMNGLLNTQQQNFAGTVLYTGQFVKKVGDGLGNLTNDTYVLAGGVVTKIPEAKTNVEGDTAQSVTEWTVHFANSPTVRAIS